MNRHHPYGGSFEAPSSRRGGSPSGPGPDRHRYLEKGGPSHRGGRGGFGRGRGGGGGGYNGNYDGPVGHNDLYDQGYSQGTDGYYNGYDTSQQAPYYQNSYGDGSAGPYGAPPSNAPYTQDYGRYEDGPAPSYDNSFDDGYNRGGGGGGGHRKGGFRRERGEAKVVDEAVIEERIQREKPCRTLFIRNIKYETDSADVKRQFEEHGDIKTFFDLISTRGMVFVTYYDLRAAERARDRLQGSEIGGRPIDVHYSLPRDDARGDREKNQQLQGTLQLTIRNSLSGQPLDDNEVRRKFQQYGDVKSIRPANDRPDSRYVEFYDMRAAEEAFDRLRHQPIQDGVMDIVLAWDPNEPAQGQGREHGRGGGDWGDDGHRGGGRGRGRGGYGRGFGRGRGGHGGGGGGSGYEDRRAPVDDGYSNRFERGGARGRGGGRFEEDGYSGGGRGGRGGGYGGDRFDSRGAPGGYGPPPPDMGGPGGYAPPPPVGGGYPPGPPPPALPPQAAPSAGPQGDDRLEQARKVQQLLAALKQPTGGAPSGPAPTGPPGAPGMASAPPGPPNGAPAAPYYAQPPPGGMGYPPGPPPSNPSMYPPPIAPAPVPPGQSLTPQPGAAPPGLENLPPNLLAMLQAAQRPPSGAGPYPPAGAVNGQPSNAQYYALMGYLQQQQQAGAKQ